MSIPTLNPNPTPNRDPNPNQIVSIPSLNPSPTPNRDPNPNQIVSILSAYVTLGAADSLPEGRMDAWVDAVRAASPTPYL